MNIRYNIDGETDLPHMYRHNVSQEDVEDVLRHPVENRPGDGNSRVLLGRTRHGRMLRVIISIDADGRGVFVVTAYDLRGKPLHALRRRMKKRGQS